MAMAETDDRDPGGEVEVAAARGVGEPHAVAVDELDARRRIGREQRAVEHGLHATTAVMPISAISPFRAALAAARSFGTMPPSKSPSSTSVSARSALIERTSQP